MAFTRTTGAFLGTDETTLSASIASGASLAGGEVDVLGDNTSVGDIWVYVVLTSTVTSGSVDITINNRRVSGQVYSKFAPTRSIVPTAGTQKVLIGKMPASRYMQASVLNNATGAACTISVLYELEKLS